MKTDLVTELDQLHIGRSYTAVIDKETGRPALERVITRGRPRGLTGDQLAAARAMRRVGVTIDTISEVLGVSYQAAWTAIGGNNA